MNLFRIKIANQVILVTAGYKGTSSWCGDFITENAPDFTIEMIQQDVESEKQIFLSNYTGAIPSGSYLEFMALLRKLSERMIDYKTLLIHGAAIGVQGYSHIFVAPSGTGKTTHILKWLEHCPDAIVINGDKPFLKINDESVIVCGSPWGGKERMYTNTTMPLKSIVLMERAEENQIEQIDFSEAFPFLFRQIYRPESTDSVVKSLQLINSLQKNTNIYRFRCNNFKDDCFDVAYHALMQTNE